ncbi:hypothetical protein [Aurantiacibacter zhengii]|uniref:Argininosuccinate lyase n=1 Tax=Aurantiacibacter zhengii TaxID=2307003 RepID=A0A418NP92_9SPHN|nr:hypothetical protein [Aurantiacibacter zhengii]RIV83917.1 hypothetical protein D2V07_15685 [Aurantiacibacter zhengii]
MTDTSLARTILATLSLSAALALSACGGAEEEDAPEQMSERPLDTPDLSGGELIAVDPEADSVPVDLPQTQMTNASEEEIEAAAAEESAAQE